jgi:hypothetical protein
MTTNVTLVHGTFARNAPWTQEGSLLRSTLTNKLGDDVTFRAFLWSGDNSFAARADAAKELRALLDRDVQSRPNDKHAVIAMPSPMMNPADRPAVLHPPLRIPRSPAPISAAPGWGWVRQGAVGLVFPAPAFRVPAGQQTRCLRHSPPPRRGSRRVGSCRAVCRS